MDVLLDEVDSLEAILMDDVKITKNPDTGFPEIIETTIFPTVGEDIDRQYICVTLQVMPKPGYPDISPKFQLIKPRGLDDNRLNEIKNACIQKLSDSLGYPVVFDLIDVIREHLTGSNLPSGQCVVCLYGFQEGDEFTKIECYHYLHSYCLARHLIASKKNYQEEQEKLPSWLRKMSDPFQATCPVCRECIMDQSENLKNSKPPSELESAPEFHLTDELKELQVKMTNLYLHQKSRGAIIDLNAEECNVLSLGPETATATTDSIFDTKNHEYNQSGNSVTIKENGTEQNASTMQTSAQSNRRSNPPQQHQNQHRNNQQQRNQSNNTVSQQPVTSGNNSSSSTNATATNNKCTNEDSTSNNHSYNRHYNRRHYHHHHRSRRHHNHHYNNNNNNDSGGQQETTSQQQKTNIRASCGSGNR